MKSEMLEIEIDSQKNSDLFFGPLGRRIRGGYDARRAAQFDQGASGMLTAWPEPIPGQRLALDSEAKQGYLREPLHDERFAATREKIVSRKIARLEPAETAFSNVDVPTWLHHIKCAVEAGVAKVISGKLPEKIEGNPRKHFRGKERKSETTHLAESIDRQTAAFERLAGAMEKLLSAVLKSK